LVWTVSLSETAEKQLGKLDRQVARRLVSFLKDRLATSVDPRALGEALTGSRFGDLWKYRQGDYRIIAKIEDEILQILVIKVGHPLPQTRFSATHP